MENEYESDGFAPFFDPPCNAIVEKLTKEQLIDLLQILDESDMMILEFCGWLESTAVKKYPNLEW